MLSLWRLAYLLQDFRLRQLGIDRTPKATVGPNLRAPKTRNERYKQRKIKRTNESFEKSERTSAGMSLALDEPEHKLGMTEKPQSSLLALLLGMREQELYDTVFYKTVFRPVLS